MHTLTLNRHLQKIVFCLFLSIFCCFEAFGQTPTYAFDPSSVTADTTPLGNTVYNQAEYLFTPGDFAPSTPGTGGMITTIYVKAGNTDASGSTFSNLQVYIGATSQTSLSSGTWVSGLGLVYTNATTAVAAWTTNGWVAITLQAPFSWDGTSNFVVGLLQNGYSNPLLLQHSTLSTRNARVYGSNTGSSPVALDSNLISFGFDLGCDGTPSTPTITTTAFSTTTPLCSGNTATINASYPGSVTNGITYQWESSSSASGPWSAVTGGTGATSLNYTTDALTASTYFRLAVTCTNTSLVSYTSDFFVPVGTSQPGNITGPAFCPGDPETYSVPNVSGTTYAWTLPSGWSGTSTTNSIVVTPGTTAGVISVTATSSCGATSIAQTFTPVASVAPSTPGSIYGNTTICPGTTQTYSTVAIAGATSYIWNFPPGWTGTSTTNSITVTTDNTSGNVSVAAVNGCGQSIFSAPLMVNIITGLATPGPITGKDTVCSGGMQSYSISPVAGATTYTWTLPSGWSGTTNGTSIQTFAGSANGTFTVTASTTCATSATASFNVAVITTVAPLVSLAAPTGSFCDNTPITFIATPTNGGTSPSYQWMKNGVPVSNSGNTYTDSKLTSADLISVDMISNERCVSNAMASSSTVSVSIIPSVTPGISINSVPPITLCKGTPVTFTTVTNGAGATPTYQWYKNGILIPGETATTYIDGALANADTITIEMTTSAACATMPIAISNKVGVRVDNPVTPTVSISVSPSNIYVPGQWLTFTSTQSNGGVTPDYQWQKNGVDLPFETGDTYTSNSLQAGDNISVKMLSYETCVTSTQVTSNIIGLKNPLKVDGDKQQGAGEISLYPNPNSGRFTIAAAAQDAVFSGKQVRIDVLNAIGQSVFHVELQPASGSWKTQVELGSELANGRYMLHIGTEDGTFRATQSFILNR